MTGFSLDDVRESFSTDVTRFLASAEVGARNMLTTAGLVPASKLHWLDPIEAIAIGMHGITGSASLISLPNLAKPALRLEALATLAQESANQIAQHVERLRKIAASCLEATSDLKQVLKHELDGHNDQAKARATKLDTAITALEHDLKQPKLGAAATNSSIHVAVTKPSAAALRGIPAIPAMPTAPPKPGATPGVVAKPVAQAPADSDAGWDTQEDSVAKPNLLTVAKPVITPGTPPVTSSAVAAADDDELHNIFQDEARETISNILGHWGRLETNPNDTQARSQITRLLHLLKGAAAAVGFADVATVTNALYRAFDDNSAQAFTASKIRTLHIQLEDLIAKALPNQVLPTASDVGQTQALPSTEIPDAPNDASATTSDDDEPREIFFEEARSGFSELNTLLAQLLGANGTARGVAFGRIDRILHRLKGSALIVGETAIAELTATGQTLSEDSDQTTNEVMVGFVEQLGKALGIAPMAAAPAVAARAPVEPARTKFIAPPDEEWAVFREEATSILDELDGLLASVEQSAKPKVEIASMFRHYHTLKGASYSVGLATIGKQLHLIESYMEQIVSVALLPNLRTLVSMLASEHTALRSSITRAATQGWLYVDLVQTEARLATIGGKADRSMAGTSWIAASDPAWHSAATSEIISTPKSAASQASYQSANSSGSTEESRRSATSQGAQDAETTEVGDGTERRFVRVAADRLDGLLDHVGELVIARSRILARIKRMHELQTSDHDRHSDVVRLIDDFANSTQFANLDGHRRAIAQSHQLATVGTSSFGALELDHYEEIHVLSRQLDESTSDINEFRRSIAVEMYQLQADTEALGAVVSELQTEISQARMLTMDSLFTRLALPIRDAAHRLGREIIIETHGETVAVDKVISDALSGSLLHMVRNAVAHGIEAPDLRLRAGKPRAGTIKIVASQEQGHVIIEVSDDGAGLNLARLKAVGVEKGLIDQSVPETDARVQDLIFAHGVSTSEGTDDVAGRGVGGNVIRRAVERLNGSIDVSTELGIGTSFRISLPLSMTITQAVLIRSGSVTLAIPIAFAEAILARDGVESVDTFGRMRVKIGANLMPVHDTRRMFPAGDDSAASVLVVCRVGSERIAIQAAEVIGQEEVVVKSLGALLEGHPIFAGTTQRGDGELVLLLDVPGVLAMESGDPSAAVPSLTPSRASSSVATEFSSNAASTSTSNAAAQLGSGSAVSVTSATSTSAVQAKSTVSTLLASGTTQLTPLERGAPTPEILRILFVDDSLSVRKVGERMLLGLGVEVVTAVDGQDALEKLRAMSFALVFTDLEMPRMHGYDLIREMQFIPAYKQIPVVVISSRSGKKHVDQALSMGAREYLPKPFTPEILQDVITRWALRKELSK